MIIGINLLYLIPGIVGGTETYASSLLYSLAEIDQEDVFIIYVNQESANWPLPERQNFIRVVCPVSAVSRVRRYAFEQLYLQRFLKEYNIDLLHSLGYVAPLMLPCHSVLTIHDILYDYPEAFSMVKRGLLKFFVTASARRADHILTVSETSRRAIASRMRVPIEKITIAMNGPKQRAAGDERRWPSLVQRLGIRGPYLLAFSSLSPSKNIPMLLRTFAQLSPKIVARDVQLVLVGHEPQGKVSLRQLTDSLGLHDRVIFSGYLCDNDLALILQHATIFVFPSLYEGFGIPVLEAMAVGVPVACSNAASLPEVAGDAALFFAPDSLEEMATILEQLLSDRQLRDKLVANGYCNLERFSWETTAKKTLEVYRRIVS